MIPLVHVTPESVFNLPLFELFFVVDTRSVDEYKQGHIASAFSFPAFDVSCTKEEKMQHLSSFLFMIAQEGSPERFNPLVFYGGSETEQHEKFVEWMGESLHELQQKNLAMVLYSYTNKSGPVIEDEYNTFQNLCQSLIQYVHEIWILEGGYSAFQKEYPFLCGNINPNDMIPLPHQIEPNLFVGSRAFEPSHKSLSLFGINHVIIHKSSTCSRIPNVQYLECDVSDEDTQNMDSCFLGANEFINAAHQQGGKVLVFVHGRTKSAYVVKAFLILSRHMTVDAAGSYFRSKCPSAYKNDALETQLHKLTTHLKLIE